MRSTFLWCAMSERFLKFIPSKEAMYLLTEKGHAFRLLTIIAESARRYDGDPDGLKIGEALIGGHENYDMSESNYRSAKDILVRRSHIEIVETCRTRKKVTTGVTTVGTKVKLLSSNVWDINLEAGHDRTHDLPTTDPRPTHDEQEYIRKIKKEKNEEHKAQTASRLHSKDVLTFNFDKWKFEGITEQDATDWKAMYPHIDLRTETLKAIEWLKSNPSKRNKKNWRKFLTGWYQRANDTAENKKAYRSATGTATQDRRTKDIHGNPVESPHDGRF